MLLFLSLLACDPVVVGLDEEVDTTAPMTWSSRVLDCVDNRVEAEIGTRWQFVQVFSFTDDKWRPLTTWTMQDNVLSFDCYSDTEQFRVSWVNIPSSSR